MKNLYGFTVYLKALCCLEFRKQFALIGVFFILIFPSPKMIAKELQQEFKVWNELAVQNAFKEGSKWHYLLQENLRLRTEGKALEEGIARLGLGYTLTQRTRLWLGYDHRAIYPENRFEKEQRSWQQISHDIFSSRSLKISSRTRFEQRYRTGEPGTSSRLRQQFAFKIPVNNTVCGILHDEIFLNLNHPVWVSSYRFEQNRLFVGVEFPAHSKTKIIVGYLNQYIQTNPKSIINHVLFLKMELKV